MKATAANRTPVRQARFKPRRGRFLDEPYLKWLRSLPCVVCGTFSRIDAAHVGPRGLGQKCSDREALPLCRRHHVDGEHSHHVLGRGFWSFWKLDRFRLIADFNRAYDGEEEQQEEK